MARAPNQKQKLLYLADILRKKTDETHTMSVAELIGELELCGVSAERKSIYCDIEALRAYGMDIICQRGRKTGYYLGARDFEAAELRLLADAVQSSKFITVKKSAELLSKLRALAGPEDAMLLSRQVHVSGRVKTMNESIYYNTDAIHNAIAKNRQISFKYFEYTVSKERKFRKNGGQYIASPMALTCDNENYYLLAYDSGAKDIRHYRVDKMQGIGVLDCEREGLAEFREADIAQYSKKVFSMFRGREENVTVRFENALAGVVIDRFGKDVPILTDGPEHFQITVPAMISPQFFGWLCGFGGEARLLSPDHVVDEFRHHVLAALG